jgi:geranylgeranyl transferase type-2 subunit beta
MAAYLEELTVRLATGAAKLASIDRERHAKYLLAAQRPDGGFAGREGASDLYYTGFALRGLAILGELHGAVAQRAADFLRSRLAGREAVVDFLSLIYGAKVLDVSAGIDIFAPLASAWRPAVASALEDLRRPDGGYAKAAEGAASSTYNTFLVLLCQQLLELTTPAPEKIVAFLMSQQCEDGGFREIRASKRAGVNPTAAAIGALRILNAIDESVRQDTIDFLAEMQSDEGGLRANTRIPFADLLSTFTGSLTLMDLGGLHELNAADAQAYVRSLERPEGGFQGFVLDPAHDVEYTFYGLGALALLAPRLDENRATS